LKAVIRPFWSNATMLSGEDVNNAAANIAALAFTAGIDVD
jgi:hypothetical protein